MTGVLSLRGLQAFEAAARSGSFVAASEELGISAAAVSQLIRALEEQAGRKLFHRANRRVVLTEAGMDVFPQLLNAFADLRSVARELDGGDHRSSLVISVAPSVAMGWLSARLPDFLRLHGSVDISLRGEDDPVPFERERIDFRLSYGRSHYPQHQVEDIVTDAVYPVCSPAFLDKYGGSLSTESMLGATLIHTDWGPSAASFPSWRTWFERASLTPNRQMQRGITANSSMAAIDFACGGLGIALGQGLFCADLVEAGRLVVAMKQRILLANPYCINLPQRSANRPMVTSFKTWFAAQCVRCVESPALVT
jgi:LysR family glycine cleavage system transcriptional activator